MSFFKTSPGAEAQIVDELSNLLRGVPQGKLEVFWGREIAGRTTELECRCGGLLQEIRHVANVPLPPKPTHKKRRILKKRLKRWEREARLREGLAMMMFVMKRPLLYRCTTCTRSEGFYSAMGRNLFPVQKFT